MKPPIIADSSGLVSLVSENDSNHKLALRIAGELSGLNTLIIVPSDVFSETMNVIGKKLGHPLAIEVGNELISSSSYSILEINAHLMDAALSIFTKQVEAVSFTDCVVMAVADNFKSKDIFGFDKVFMTNGYHRLGLKDN